MDRARRTDDVDRQSRARDAVNYERDDARARGAIVARR